MTATFKPQPRSPAKIDKVTIALDRPKLTPDDVKKFEAAERAAQDAD